jgi:Bacterial regulatory proteins, tetR family
MVGNGTPPSLAYTLPQIQQTVCLNNVVARPYRLGARQASVDRTAAAILDAAGRLLAQSPAAEVSVGAVAREAGVSRLTVYQRFGSRPALFAALVPNPPVAEEPDAEPREGLRHHFLRTCERWAASPALFRHLQLPSPSGQDAARRLAERLLAADALRPGCSLREAEDVIAVLGSFAVFDRLHRDGRRSPAAVADVLMRLAAAILA